MQKIFEPTRFLEHFRSHSEGKILVLGEKAKAERAMNY